MSDSLGSRPKLRRLKAKGWIGGVCAGFGYWIGMPTWLVRLIWTVMVLAYGVGGILYISALDLPAGLGVEPRGIRGAGRRVKRTSRSRQGRGR